MDRRRRDVGAQKGPSYSVQRLALIALPAVHHGFGQYDAGSSVRPKRADGAAFDVEGLLACCSPWIPRIRLWTVSHHRHEVIPGEMGTPCRARVITRT